MHRKTFRIRDAVYKAICEYAADLGKKEGKIVTFTECARRLMILGLKVKGYDVPEEKKRRGLY